MDFISVLGDKYPQFLGFLLVIDSHKKLLNNEKIVLSISNLNTDYNAS